jgi:hypothetical protein
MLRPNHQYFRANRCLSPGIKILSLQYYQLKNKVMADNRNQNWNQEESRTQQSDQKNESMGSEQRTGSEIGQQDRSQQGSSDSRSSNLGEQSEKSSSDTETQDV